MLQLIVALFDFRMWCHLSYTEKGIKLSLTFLFIFQCPRNTGSWSRSCAHSWSPGRPSRSWSREESSGRGCSVVTWESIFSTRAMMVSLPPSGLSQKNLVYQCYRWVSSTPAVTAFYHCVGGLESISDPPPLESPSDVPARVGCQQQPIGLKGCKGQGGMVRGPRLEISSLLIQSSLAAFNTCCICLTPNPPWAIARPYNPRLVLFKRDPRNLVRLLDHYS